MLNGMGLFEGVSGITLGLEWAGLVDPICFVECESYPQEVLKLRYPEVPIWDDVRTFDGKPWKGIIDIISGGFPCQDISVAGKGAGIKEGTRSGLWFEFCRIISEVRPLFAIIENVPALLVRGGTGVIANLAEIGYDAEWTIISAAGLGANHLRKRIFIMGYPEYNGLYETNGRRTKNESSIEIGKKTKRESERASCISEYVADSESENDGSSNTGKMQRQIQKSRDSDCKRDLSNSILEHVDSPGPGASEIRWRQSGQAKIFRNCNQWVVEPAVDRVADGVPARVDRLKCLGNAVVPQCAEYIGRLIMEAITK